MSAPSIAYATFWQGALSPYELAVFASYARRGQALRVYSFDPEIAAERNLFNGEDASVVLSSNALRAFIYGAKPDVRHFSDLFRLELSRSTGEVWVDADMLLLRAPPHTLPRTILAREWGQRICNSVLRIDPEDQRLQSMISECYELAGKELRWGETGPIMLTRYFGMELKRRRVFHPRRFYPIDFNDFWRAFLPEECDFCETQVRRAWGVHLWNNIHDELGIIKHLAPPEGSFLWKCFSEDGTLGLFQGIYPVHAMRSCIKNFRLRKSGEDLGIKTVLSQVLPSVARTVRHYRK